MLLKIRVTDTGIGMKEEELKHIFDAFQRLDEKRNQSVEGTGLGMTITKQLIELMGGKISVRSKCGVGSSDAVLWKIRKIGMLYHKMLWFEGKNWSKK